MFGNRVKELQKKLRANKIDAILVSSAVNIHYLTGYSNFSTHEREAYLFVSQLNAVLFTDGRYIEAVEKTLPANAKVTIKPIAKTLNQIVKKEKIKIIGFEHNLTFAEYEKIKKEISIRFLLVHNLVEDFRNIKNVEEIKSIKKATKLTDDCYSHILKNVRIRMTEKEVAWEIEMFIKKLGGTLAFDSIVAFGTNSSVPHHLTSDKKLSEKDEFILLDFGAKVDGYCADMTRTLLTKNASNKARKIYETVLGAQMAAVDYLNTNKKMSGRMAWEVADEYIVKKGFPKMPHGLGHGIGLEVHESPRLSKRAKDYIKNGMTFTIEPGIYIPGFGGVRIEDDYLWNGSNLEQLTKSPKDLIEIKI